MFTTLCTCVVLKRRRKARLAMHTIAHIASWDSASARSVMERCLGRMPSAHWVANQREEGSAYLPEGTDDFNAALIEAFGGVIGNARHVGVGAAGWVWDEERESPVDLVVWLLRWVASHTHTHTQQNAHCDTARVTTDAGLYMPMQSSIVEHGTLSW